MNRRSFVKNMAVLGAAAKLGAGRVTAQELGHLGRPHPPLARNRGVRSLDIFHLPWAGGGPTRIIVMFPGG